MPNNKYQISLAIIEELKRKGYNQTQIAEMFDVSRQAVSYHKVVYGGTRTPREIVNDHFPFKAPRPFSQQSPCRRLRDHGEYMATGGKGMSEAKLKRLRAFYKKLRDENVVVEFDPNIPPTPGVCRDGGFAFRTRLPEDEDLLVRVNEYTTLSEEGRMIWRFPPVDP